MLLAMCTTESVTLRFHERRSKLLPTKTCSMNTANNKNDFIKATKVFYDFSLSGEILQRHGVFSYLSLSRVKIMHIVVGNSLIIQLIAIKDLLCTWSCAGDSQGRSL